MILQKVKSIELSYLLVHKKDNGPQRLHFIISQKSKQNLEFFLSFHVSIWTQLLDLS